MSLVRKKILWSALPVLCLLVTACQPLPKDDHFRSVFAAFFQSIQMEEFRDTDSFVHPDSPFNLRHRKSEARKRYWKVQQSKLFRIGGQLEMLEFKKTTDKVTMKYRISPGPPELPVSEGEVVFAKNKSRWKVLVPEAGIEFYPHRIDKAIAKSIGDQLNMSSDGLATEVQAEPGFDSGNWKNELESKKNEQEGSDG
jgi:hypothetical protein